MGPKVHKPDQPEPRSLLANQQMEMMGESVTSRDPKGEARFC